MPPRALMVCCPLDLDYVKNRLVEGIQRTHGVQLSGVYVGRSAGVPIAVAGPMLGAPAAVMVLEKLIALGAVHLIATGWCGSLQHHVTIGHHVLANSAVPEEGTSQHYPMPGDPYRPDPDLVHALDRALKARSAMVHTGSVWTTDAPYRETPEKVLAHQQQGVLAVEMEASALFAVARFRRVRLAAAMAVSDELATLQWRHGFKHPDFARARADLLQAALLALVEFRTRDSS